MVYFVAFGCKYKHVKGSGISFHSFLQQALEGNNGCITANVQTTYASLIGKLCSNHFSNKEQLAVHPETYTQYGYENTKASLKEDAVPDIPIEVAP